MFIRDQQAEAHELRLDYMGFAMREVRRIGFYNFRGIGMLLAMLMLGA